MKEAWTFRAPCDLGQEAEMLRGVFPSPQKQEDGVNGSLTRRVIRFASEVGFMQNLK